MSIVLTLLAAVAFAFSTVLQQGTARVTALRHGTGRLSWLPVLGFLGRLVRDPVWLLGWGLNGVGFIMHAIALHYGAIAVVQAVLVVQLLMALFISAIRRHLRPTARDWSGAFAVCAGVATLVLLRGDVEQRPASSTAILAFAGAVVTVQVTLLTIARWLRHRRAQLRTALVAVSAGLCFCTTAVLLVVVTGDIANRGPLGVVGWPLVGIIASAIVGTLLVQDAFSSGSLPTAVTAMTITDPVTSAVVGAVLFDAVRPSGLELWLGLPVAGALVVTGVTMLATSRTLHDERHLHALMLPPVEPELSGASRDQGEGSRFSPASAP